MTLVFLTKIKTRTLTILTTFIEQRLASNQARRPVSLSRLYVIPNLAFVTRAKSKINFRRTVNIFLKCYFYLVKLRIRFKRKHQNKTLL